ncbi:MAG TPA: dynamin family protein [Candidatus Eisenbacteria bacterium]|nr:dynamin family protein [Candidatus Eisenbacteria bacterium]
MTDPTASPAQRSPLVNVAERSAAPTGGAAERSPLVDVAERLAALAQRRDLDRWLLDDAARRTRQLRDHLAGHVLPRARSLDAPLLVLVVGPTGAGKSSLLNALAGAAVSPSGVIRPTTRELVVLTRPGDADSLQAGGTSLAALAGDRLRLVESPSLAEGIALVDSPDVDSIEHANRELTDRLVEAADLAIFVTTATRYADRVPWEVLRRARDRGLPLVVVVNRMPTDGADQSMVLGDIERLLADNGIQRENLELVSIPEGALDPEIDALAASAVEPVRARIDALGAHRDARRALAARALAGSLVGLAPLVERVADDVEHEAIEADALRRSASHAFQTELTALREQLASGTFLRAEALRQWQAFVGADEITRFFSSGIGKLRGTISALIRGTPRAPVAEVREDTLADLLALSRTHAGEAARRTATAWSDEASTRDLMADDPTLWSTSPGFEAALRTRLEEWITGIADDVQRTGGPKRLLARGASVGVNAAGIGVMLATFAHTGGLTGTEVGVAAATGFLNQKLLEALFGEAALVEMIQRARANLAAAISASFDEELARYERLVPEGDSLRELAVELRAAAKDVTELQPPDAFEADPRGPRHAAPAPEPAPAPDAPAQ